MTTLVLAAVATSLLAAACSPSPPESTAPPPTLVIIDEVDVCHNQSSDTTLVSFVRLSATTLYDLYVYETDGNYSTPTLVYSDLGGYNVGISKVLNVFQERMGSEIYDVEARHGKNSPVILIVYIVGGAVLIVLALRRMFRGAAPEA